MDKLNLGQLKVLPRFVSDKSANFFGKMPNKIAQATKLKADPKILISVG